MANPTFQHRHYAAIADVLADMRKENETLYGGGSIRADLMDRLEERFVRLFMGDNARFQAGRFRSAANRAPDMNGRDKVR